MFEIHTDSSRSPIPHNRLEPYFQVRLPYILTSLSVGMHLNCQCSHHQDKWLSYSTVQPLDQAFTTNSILTPELMAPTPHDCLKCEAVSLEMPRFTFFQVSIASKESQPATHKGSVACSSALTPFHFTFQQARRILDAVKTHSRGDALQLQKLDSSR